MNELVSIFNNQPVTSSRNVSLNFEKRHADVIRAIEDIKEHLAQKSAQYFVEDTYTTSRESWKRVIDLKPNRNILAAWHDIDVYIENIDRQAVMREADEDAKKTVPIDD